MTAFASIAVDLRMKTKRFETDLGRADRIAKKKAKSIERSMKRAATSFAVGFGGAAVGIAAFSKSMASAITVTKEFQTAMAEVSTLLNDKSGMAKMTKETREMAKAFGTSHLIQAKARYQAISGGVSELRAQTELLTAANKLAVGGLATVEESTRGLLAVMNAYGDQIGSAEEAADAFFVTMKKGITTIPEIVQSIGGVAGIASQTGVEFEELLAIFGSGTRVSKSAANTMDALRGVLAAIAKSSSQANNEMMLLNKQMGTDIEFSIAGMQDAGGLFPFLAQIKDITKGSDASISKLFGRVEAMNLIFQIMGEGFTDTKDILKELEKRAGQTQIAFSDMMDTPQKKIDVFKATIADLGIDLATNFVNNFGSAAKWMSQNLQLIIDALQTLAVAITAVITIQLGATFTAWIVAAGGLRNAWIVLTATVNASGTVWLNWQSVAVGALVAVGFAWKQYRDLQREGMLPLQDMEEWGERYLAVLKESKGIISTADAGPAMLVKQIATLRESMMDLFNVQAGLEQRLQPRSVGEEFLDLIDPWSESEEKRAENMAQWSADLVLVKANIKSLRAEIQRLTTTETKALTEWEKASKAALATWVTANDAAKAAHNSLMTDLEKEEAAYLSRKDIFEEQLRAAKALIEIQKDSNLPADTAAFGVSASQADLNAILKDLARNEAAWKKFKTTLVDVDDTLNDIQDAGRSAIESLFTPLERGQAAYNATNKALNNYLATLKEGTREYDRAYNAIIRNNKAWMAQRKAIKTAITPYQAFVKVLKDQIALEDGTTTAHKKRIEDLKVEAAAIAKTADELKVMLGLIEQLNAASGKYGFGYNTIGDVIREAFADGAKDFAKVFKNIRGGSFDQKSNFVADAANYVGDLVNTFKNAKDAGKTTLAALNDVAKMIPIPIVQAVSAIAGLIDDLTGGGLFGTKYKVDKTITTLGIGADGVFGGTDVFKSKKKSFFRGTKRKVDSDPLTAEARKAITAVFDAINEAVGSAARALAVTIPDVIGGAFEQEFDADNNLVKEFSTVLGKVYEESFEEFGKRLIGENLIAVISERFDGVSEIAERWRDDATKLLEGANLLLVIAGELKDGFNLFEISFSSTVDIIEELSYAGEELSDTYLRLKHDTELLERATALMGVSLDLSRENFVRFAAKIEEAAGGIERATELWVSFFETFTTANERAVTDMATAVEKQAELLAGIGTDAASFAAEFKRLLPTMTAEEIATWLKAGEAIAAVIKLEDILRQQREELQDVLGDMGVFSAFRMELIDLQRSLAESLKRAEQLGASERELALIRKHSERTLKRMISDLRASTAEMANTFLSGMSEGQLGFLEEEAKRLEDLSSERRSAYEAELSAIRKLKEFADSLLLNGALTPLTPAQQLAEARSQFQSTLAAAQGGDLSAMQNLPGIANSFLDIARSFFASSSDYTDIFNQVQSGLRGVGTSSQYDPLINQLASVEEEIAALQAVISANSQAVSDFQNALAITALLENIAALASFGGMSLEDVAAQFGLDMDTLTTTLTGLGISGFDPESILAQAALDAAFGGEVGTEITDISIGINDLNTIAGDLREDGDKNDDRHTAVITELEETNRLLTRALDEGLLSRNVA